MSDPVEFAARSAEFVRGTGRHAWARTPEGWRIVAAQVSLLGDHG